MKNLSFHSFILYPFATRKESMLISVRTTMTCLLTCLLIIFFIAESKAELPPISGTKTVGSGGDYDNLTDAFAAINSNGLNGNLDLQLIAGYPAAAETYPIVSSNAAAVGSFNIHIYPTVSGLSISSANATGTLNLNNGTNINLDGRINGTGSTKSLIVENTTTGGPAIRFINDATGNTVQYCILRGVTTGTTTGTILFSTTTGTLGNSNNTITHNDIQEGATTPTVCIYSAGTLNIPNNNNTISNNNIFNFYHSTSTTTAGIGIGIGSNNNNWTITNNSFYQTATRSAFGATGPIFSAIQVTSTSVNGLVITNNYVGGTAPLCSGTPMTLTAASPLVFRGFMLTVGTTTPTSIQGNTIQNFSVTSTSATTAQSCINMVSGSFNCGNVTGNTIGSQSSTGSITFSTSGSNAVFSGILAGSGTPGVIAISNNTIGGLTVSGATSLTTRGISALGAATSYVISNNTIGSPSVVNSITSSTNSSLVGIYSSSTSASITVSNNTVAHLTQLGTTTGNVLAGMLLSAGTCSTTGNTIRNLTSASTGIGTGSSASIIGISHTAAAIEGQTVSQNIIHTLSNTTATAAVSVTGIYYSGPATGTNLVSANFVHSLNATSNMATASGIVAGGGASAYQNNMIRLGLDGSGNSITNSIRFIGIDKTTTANNNFYHNSLCIGGTAVASDTVNTIAFRRTLTGTDDIRNNIFLNDRSSVSGTGKHYAIGLNATTTTTLDYNLYEGTGTGFMLGYMGSPGSSDYATLLLWKTATSLDAASSFGDPQYIAPNGNNATVNLHIHPTNPSPVEAAGVLVSAVANDFDNQTRSTLTPTDIGADAGDFVTSPNMTFVSCTTTQNNTSNVTTNSINQEVIGIQIVTNGSNNPLSVSQFSLNTNGTTSTTDIANAKVFFTGTNSAFSTGQQVGSTVAAPDGSFMISGTQLLSEGTNYFWLTYDIPCGAVSGNSMDAECNSVTVGSPQTPAVQAPAGSRTLVAPMLGVVTNVDDNGPGSLRDVLTCVGDGATITIDGSLTGQTITLTSGETLINKNITIVGLGALNLSLSGNNASRIFHVQTGKTLNLQAMTLRDATAVTNGGAVWVEGYLILNNVTIQNCFENGTPKSLTLANPSNLDVIGTVEMKN